MAKPDTSLERLPRRVQKPLTMGNHKRRSAWFRARAGWPDPSPPATLRQRAIEHMGRMRPAAGRRAANWQSVGPTNVGGRVTSIVVDPGDADRLWIGAANGGVWTSDDAGQTWNALWSHQESLVVGSLAIDPSNSQVLYAGAGEGNASADSYPGVGVYRSANGGQSWTLWAEHRSARIPSRIGALVVDPSDGKRLWLGGLAYQTGQPRGLYRSTDRGKTWKQLTVGPVKDCWCRSIVLDPGDPDTLYVNVTARSTFDGIYRSRDGGDTWEHLTAGLPTGDVVDRIALAIAPSDPAIIYAQASGTRSSHLGIFRSLDRGDHWADISGTEFTRERQMNYNNVLAVHPGNPNWLLAGGVDLHLTQDGGASWSQVTDWRADRGAQNYAHADQHGLVMPPGEPGRVYAVNDGGVDVSRDGGRTWANRSAGLAITMFYDFDVAQSDPGFFGGGTQDNGSNVTLEGQADKYIDVTGGDGGWLVIDPGDANHFIASIYNGFIFRWTGRWEEIPLPLTDAERDRVWMVFIAMDRQDPLTLVTGTDRVWRTNDGGKVWTAVSDVLDGSLVSSVAIAPSESARIYVGTENGGIFRSVDRGDSWSGNLAGAIVPSFLITRLTVHPTNPSLVYATVANSGHSHVYRSVDGGDTWQDVDRGKLPDIAHSACVIDPDDSTTLYVANDVGVFMSGDEGGSWTSVSANLPRVPVTDLVLHQQTRRLFAATYGRSAYALQLDVPPGGRARRQQPRRRSPRRRARK